MHEIRQHKITLFFVEFYSVMLNLFPYTIAWNSFTRRLTRGWWEAYTPISGITATCTPTLSLKFQDLFIDNEQASWNVTYVFMEMAEHKKKSQARSSSQAIRYMFP